MRKAVELQPQAAQSYMLLATIQILRGNSGAAVEFAKKETDPFWRTQALALAHFANGDRAEADAALKKLIDETPTKARARSLQSTHCARNRTKCSSGWSTAGPRTTQLWTSY